MSQPGQNKDETQLDQTEEIQDVKSQGLESGDLEAGDEVVAAPHKKKAGKKAPVMREPGKTLFPMSRVQKIIKADKVDKKTRPL
jgi:hypothetical protein